jgi:hypothetical protein
MRIAIKYCGGCNPTYDRVACVTHLKESFADLDFVSYNEEEQFDYCLLIRGCNRACVSDKQFSNCRHFYAVSSEEELLEIKNRLCAQVVKDEHAK